MVRRKRAAVAGLSLPRHLTADAVWADPDRWNRERLEWGRQHPWPPGKIGFLPFFLETASLWMEASGDTKWPGNRPYGSH